MPVIEIERKVGPLVTGWNVEYCWDGVDAKSIEIESCWLEYISTHSRAISGAGRYDAGCSASVEWKILFESMSECDKLAEIVRSSQSTWDAVERYLTEPVNA